MSSILDALRKLEEAETPSPGGGAPFEERSRRLPLAIAAVVIAFVAGAGVAFWVRRERASAPAKPVEVATPRAPAAAPPPTPPPSVAPVKPVEVAAAPVAVAPAPAAAPAPPAPPAPPPVAATPEPPAPVARDAAPAPPPAAPPAPEVEVALRPATPTAPPTDIAADPPRGHVIEPPAARRVERAAPAAHAAAPEPVAPTPPPPAPEATAPATPPEPAPVVAAREPEPAPPPPDVLPGPPIGAPAIGVNVLVYSRTPSRRTVALTIGDAGMVTLHEGESAADVEVVRILSDRVHVRYGGQTFSVRAVP